MIECPSCGAKLKYDINSQMIKCDFCKSTFDPKREDLKSSVAKEITIENNDNLVEAKNYICQSCGAELLTFDETAATFCNYCGSESMLEDRLIKINKPDFVIPFKISKEECIKIYEKKVKNNFLIPKYMKDNFILEKIHGIYMPYAIYKFNHSGITRNKGSKYWKHSGNYDYYKDYLIEADVTANVEGISYDLVSNFYDQYSMGISPYDYNEAVPFNLNYISGFYADKKDVENQVYTLDAKEIAEKYMSDKLRERKEFRKYGCSNPKLGLKEDTHQIGMFPVYFLAFRNRENNTISYAVINGQTGKIAADMPIDFIKYLILSIFISIISFVIVNSFLRINCKTLLILGIIMSFISFVISKVNLSKINSRKTYKDDAGMKNKKVKSEQKLKSSKYVRKQIIGFLLGIVIMIIQPVNDIYYYLGAIILFALNVLSCNDIVKEHNMLTTRKIPQLEKRGGDKNE